MTQEVPETMMAAMLHKNGDPTTSEVLSVVQHAVPEPHEGEVLVKVSAAAINPVDWKLMKGLVPGMKQGLVGFDVSGTVVRIGPNTTSDLKVGEEIYADAAATKGTFAEYARVQTKAISRKPKNISMDEAASFPLAGLTALQGLLYHGHFKSGQKVLIFGGSGGVGSLAVQMAKALGASEVYSTGSNPDMIKKFGADVVVNYKEESLMDALKGKEFDVVYDTIGGYEHWEVAQASMKRSGHFVTIVGDGGSLVTTLAKYVWRKLMGAVFWGPSYTMVLTDTESDVLPKDMKKMTELIENGKIKPVLDDRKFELTTESIHEMVKASMSHQTKGKLILRVQ